MKYLMQNKKEFVITIGVFATVLIVLIWSVASIIRGSFGYENLVAIVGIIFEILGWYYNIPTSEENSKYTGLMRLEKEQNSGIITGEDFTDEAEEEPEDVEDGVDIDEEEIGYEKDDGPNDDGGDE